MCPKDIASKIRKLPWSEVHKVLHAVGWKVREDTPKLKKYVKDDQMLSVVKVGPNKWKVEHFIKGRMADSAGISEEEYAKILATELGILRGFKPDPDKY